MHSGEYRRFVNQDGPELQLAQPRITCTHTRAADDIRGAQNFLLALPNQSLVLPLIVRAQLPLLVLELDKLLQLDMRGIVRDLLMQRQERDGRVERLAGLRRQAHDLQAGCVDLLGKLVNSDVRWRTDEHLAGIHLGQMVYDGGRCHGLSGTGGTLDKTDRLLEDALDRIHLGVIQLGQSRSREALGHLGAKYLRLELVAQQFVVLYSPVSSI
ncbi:hypothetical protein DENSPDRAFT_595198 [Dentipellis sp. KUC8613]|nr:hypothetical protein DENSPDRAFT_595198 [Dentipellis sp. KUC8613]